MSRYDIVEVGYPLPDGVDPLGVEYRTRDLGRAGRRYRLDGSGQLWLERWAGEEERAACAEGLSRLPGLLPSECEWVAWPFGGTFAFYTRQGGRRRAYLALFRRGKCVHVERVGVSPRWKGHERCRVRSRRRE